MHELYYCENYLEVPGVEPMCFYSWNCFTDVEWTYTVDKFNTFNDLLSYIKSVQPCGVSITDTGICKQKEGIEFWGTKNNYTIMRKEFKPGTAICTRYTILSPKINSLDFYKDTLSLDDFITFMQEHYGDKVVIAVN